LDPPSEHHSLLPGSGEIGAASSFLIANSKVHCQLEVTTRSTDRSTDRREKAMIVKRLSISFVLWIVVTVVWIGAMVLPMGAWQHDLAMNEAGPIDSLESTHWSAPLRDGATNIQVNLRTSTLYRYIVRTIDCSM